MGHCNACSNSDAPTRAGPFHGDDVFPPFPATHTQQDRTLPVRPVTSSIFHKSPLSCQNESNQRSNEQPDANDEEKSLKGEESQEIMA